MTWNVLIDVARALRTPSFVRERLSQEMPSGIDSYDLLLVTTELVTNAVLHGADPVRASFTIGTDAVRIEVADALPRMGPRGPQSRGLQLVEALATEWGIQPVSGDGKVVWAEVPLRPAAT